MQLPEPRRRAPGENVVPLINVVFLLLMFFMIVGSFTRPTPFTVDPPHARSDEAPAKEATVPVIYLAADGRLALDQEEVEMDALGGRVVARLRSRDDKRVRIEADARATAETVMRLLDVLRSAGAGRIELTTVVAE